MRTTLLHSLPALVLPFLLALPARADVVTTSDGRQLEGLVKEVLLGSGDGATRALEVQTPYGSCTVPWDQVVSWEKRPCAVEEYVARQRDLVEGFAEPHYALARWCETKGLLAQARAELERAFAIDPADERVRLALGWRLIGGEWISPERALEAAGFVRFAGKWMLPGEIEVLKAQGGADVTLDELVVQNIRSLGSRDGAQRQAALEALAGAARERIVPQLLLAVKDHDWHLRAGAAALLGRFGDAKIAPTLYTVALIDREKTVREAAIRGLREGRHTNAYAAFVKALASEQQPLRLRAVQALRDLGDRRAVTYLIKHIKYSGGGPRVHLFIGSEVSYIKDYDVEVAAESQIADPIVGTLQEGIMLDVRFAGIHGEGVEVERVLTHGALKTLTGAEPARPDSADLARAWTNWWRQNRQDYEPGGARYEPAE